MAADHPSAILAALRANVNLNVKDGAVPSGTAPPYVAVYVYFGRETREGLPPVTNNTPVMIVTHSVGANATAARGVASYVRAALLDVRMTVTGAQCSPTTHEASQPPMRDESTGVLVLDQVDEWDYTARPA